MNDLQTIASFIESHGLTMTAAPVASNPNMADDMPGGSHWACTISKGGGKITVPFSQGAAHRQWNQAALRKYRGTYTPKEIAQLSPVLGARGLGGAPESVALRELREECAEPTPPALADVLNCMKSDSQGLEDSNGFDDWASNYGYDTDSRKAEATYRACQDQAQQLRHMLGLKAYGELLECEGL